jgi:uncharacterized membrane protein YeaQ/YmgE (transglycosylase-associated protein family)
MDEVRSSYGHLELDHRRADCGVLAKWVIPGRDPSGIIVTALIAIVVAILGAVVLLAIYRWGAGRSTSRV